MKKHLISLALLFMTTLNANASVILGGTRVIYEGNKKEASISVRNDDKTPYLVQSWVNNFNNNDKQKVPFTVTPPLFRIEHKHAVGVSIAAKPLYF